MKEKFLLKLLILLPIFDLITSLSRRFLETTFSFGIIIKFIIMILLFSFILIYKDNDKRKLIVIFLLYLLYILTYLILKLPYIFENSTILFNEIYSLSRFFFFPIVFFILYFLIKKGSIDINKFKKTMIISIGIYIFVFAISYLTRTSFNSYIGENLGGIGWYYAANEISSIMILLFPFIYYLLEKNKVVLFYIAGIISIFFISLIGTKVSSFGILIISILYLILPIIFKIKNYKKNIKHNVFLILIMVFILFGSPSMFNLKIATEKVSSEYLNEQEKFEKECESGNKCDNYYYRKVMLMLLSGRNVYLKDTKSVFNKNLNVSTFLFGIGISNSPKIENESVGKWIEMDFFDLYFNYGVVGTLLVLSPLLFAIYMTIKKKIIFKSMTYENTIYMLIILLILSVSFIAGHVISAPAVSTYLVIYLLLYLGSINALRKEDILDINKISILSLHLGHGGIEQANINLSNMLSKKYNVELVSLYKTLDEIPYKYDNKINIKYLTNIKPNKDEFINAIKEKNVVHILKEGLKSIKILILKRYLIEKYIINSDSKYIISSRLEFNRELSLFGRDKTIKISQEHSHHNNDLKYINKLKNSLKNIDYFLPVSQELKDFYSNEFKSLTNLKVDYIRHCLDYYPEKPNKYNGKKLIFVGRFSKEKGLLDLIEVFKELNKKDKEYELTLVGFGNQGDQIKQKIKEYKLSKKIILTGFLNKNDVHKIYSKSSLYIMTSTSEAFGLVLIEAMSFGIPCVAFDSASGSKEIINSKNGIILKGRDIVEMANVINDIFNNRTLYDNMSKEARITSEKYKFEIIQKEWLQFIERI